MRTVAAIPAVALVAGSALGLLLPDIPLPFTLAALIASSIGAVCAARAGWTRTVAALIAVAFAGGGAALAARGWRDAWRPPLRIAFESAAREQRVHAIAEGRVMPEDDEAFATVEGALRQDAAPIDSGASVSVEVDTFCAPRCQRARGGIVATVVGSMITDRIESWRAGRRVRMPATLRRPARYLDPGVVDHERALARRGTTLVGTVKSGALVEVVAEGSVLAESMASARKFARHAIAAAVGRWSSRSAAIVAAIVIGDRAGLDESVQRALQEAGTYHVIAISGGNIAILAAVMLGAFRFAGVLGRTAMLAAMATLVAYGYLVGGGASVDRATLMAVVYFAGRAIDQRSPPVNSLAVAASVLVVVDSLSVADPAFVLTFGATLAILLVMPIVAHWRKAPASDRRRLTSIVTALIGMFAASVAAEAMLFPVGALVFSRVTFAGLALNFLAIPLMAVAQIAGMALVPVAAVSSIAAALIGYVAHLGADGLVRSAQLVRFAPAVTYRVAAPGWFAVSVYYASACVAWTLWRRSGRVGSGETAVSRQARWLSLAASALAASWILFEPWTIVAARGDGGLRITFIDVGQGDSAFVRFPHGATLLVDAGGLGFESPFDVGDRVVAPVLREAGVRRLDILALTHGDPDHIGGANAIVREFRPRQIWEGIAVPRSEALAELKSAARALAIPWRNVRTGDRVALDDVEVLVRHPETPDWERQKARNDDSIVLELRWREASVLLTGDIGRDVERTLVDAMLPSPLRVLKVPHHGSLTSSTPAFVRAIEPRVAVFSVGRANHFGHPVAAVLERYKEVGSEIFRTDRDGAVMVATDGYSIAVRSFMGRHVDLPRKHEDTKTGK